MSAEKIRKENEAARDLLDTLDKITDRRREISNLTTEELDQTIRLNQAQSEFFDLFDQIEDKRIADLEIIEASIAQQLNGLEEFSGKSAEITKIINEMKSGAESMGKEFDDLPQSVQDLILEFQKLNELQEAQKRYGKDQKQLFGDIAGALGINNNLSKTFLGTFINVGKTLKDNEAAQKTFNLNFKEAFSLTNLLVSGIQKVVEATMAQVLAADKARAALAAATATANQFSDVMVAAQEQGNLLGISMSDAGAATGQLVTQTTNFVNISPRAQADLATTVAALTKIGVSGTEAAKSFQFFNLNLGMSADQAGKTAVELGMMGTQLGISTEKITRDFNSSLTQLAVYGPRSIDIFKGIAAAAKVAGVEVSSLLGLAERFDTFAGAAETIGKLNALLGTQLSTTEMLTMTEDQRLETLIRTVQEQGIAFNDMDRFSQKAIASAAGIRDLNEAQKIFGMNLQQFGEYRSQMERNADAQAKFEKAVTATMDITNKFKVLVAEFAVFVAPALNTIHSVLDTTLDFFEQFSPETREMIVIIATSLASVTLALKFFLPIVASATTMMAALNLSMAPVLLTVLAVTAGIVGLTYAIKGFSGAASNVRPTRLPSRMASGQGVTAAAMGALTSSSSGGSTVNNYQTLPGDINIVLEDGRALRGYVHDNSIGA